MKKIILILFYLSSLFCADLTKLTYDAKTNIHTVTDRTKQGTAEDFNDIKTVVNLACTRIDSTRNQGVLKLAKIGTVANYSEVEADGTLKFNGSATVYNDAVVPFLYKGGSGEAEFEIFVGSIRNLKVLTGDLIAFQNTEAPHSYKEGSAIELHLHWAVNNAMDAGEKVRWVLESAFANMNNGTNTGVIFCNPATPTVFGVRKDTLEYTAPVGGVAAGTYLYSSLATISAANMSNVKIGAGFIGQLSRIAKSAGGADPTTGSVYALNVGIHYESDTIGSRLQGVK